MLADGAVRVSSRYPIDDLDELFGFDVEEEDVDSVGGLMAKHLGRVPIPGSHVEAHGLRFEAEDAAGRRNKIGTVLIRPGCDPVADSDEPRETGRPPAIVDAARRSVATDRLARRPRLSAMELSTEDAKLVTLARATRARTQARRGRRGPRRRRSHVRRRDGRPALAAALGAPGVRGDGGRLGLREGSPRPWSWGRATR